MQACSAATYQLLPSSTEENEGYFFFLAQDKASHAILKCAHSATFLSSRVFKLSFLLRKFPTYLRISHLLHFLSKKSLVFTEVKSPKFCQVLQYAISGGCRYLDKQSALCFTVICLLLLVIHNKQS